MTGAESSPRRAARQGRRRGLTAVGVLGEILLTLGVVLLLYVAWQLWIGDAIQGAQNNAAGAEISQQWESLAPAGDSDAGEEPDGGARDDAAPVVADEPADGERFGVLHVPRFGAEYAVPMAGGVSRAVTLDPIGVGHYPGTAMPGGVGNFAVAAHRTTYGAPFNRIAELRLGDAIIVETEDGWYTYRFRTLEYVVPTAVDVLDAVPQVAAESDGERYLTMTSCSPMFSLAERIVAYGVFDGFSPRADGPPAELIGEVDA